MQVLPCEEAQVALRIVGFGQSVEALCPLLLGGSDQAQDRCTNQIILVGEMAIDRLLGNRRHCRDLVRVGPRVAFLDIELQRCVEDRTTDIVRVGARLSLGGRCQWQVPFWYLTVLIWSIYIGTHKY